MDIEKIRSAAEGALSGDMFLVEVKLAPGNVIEVTVDSDTGVGIDDCVALSRAIEGHFDREVEDFELTVASAGVGQPLQMLRQYTKLVGKPVEVLLAGGTKIVAELRAATPDSITLAWQERATVEGSKRKQLVERLEEYPRSEVKWTKEHLDFK